MAEVCLDRIEKFYGQIHAVKPVDLTIHDGEFLVLLGPSGCGKSTMLRIIAGLEPISAGDLYIGGDRVSDWTPPQRNIAMVFQSYALYPHLTVAGNLAFPLEAQGVPKSTINERVQEIARVVGLANMLDRKPGELSGGQRQRVAVGRAMVRQPTVFLFDEPLSNLDAKLRDSMRGELIRLHAQLKNTVIYVTHDQVEAMTMADRVVVMNEGVIQQVGTPREVYEYPANYFVAQFIGSPMMNFLPGTLEKRGRESVLRVADSSVNVAIDDHETKDDTCNVKVGFRATDCTLDSSDADDTTIDLPIEVLSLQPLGHDVLIDVKAIEMGWVGVIQQTWRGNRLEPGQHTRLVLPREFLHLFEDENGQRIRLSTETSQPFTDTEIN